jgi:hypothetical protein
MGRHRRLSAWRSIASISGSAPISRTSCAQRQATAILAAHSSASSREGTSTSVTPLMASGYGPSLTVPDLRRVCALGRLVTRVCAMSTAVVARPIWQILLAGMCSRYRRDA